MNDEEYLSYWYHYHNTPTRNVRNRAGALGDLVVFPGPTLTAVGGRVAGTSAPTDKAVGGITLEFQCPSGMYYGIVRICS